MKKCLSIALNNPKFGHKIYLQVVGLHFAVVTKFSKSEIHKILSGRDIIKLQIKLLLKLVKEKKKKKEQEKCNAKTLSNLKKPHRKLCTQTCQKYSNKK